MLVSEIATRVKRQFGDESGAQIDDTDIIRWVNDAQKEIAIKSDLLQVKATQVVTQGVAEYAFPTGLLTLRSVRYNETVIQPLSLAEAENFVSQSSTIGTGTPTHYWVWAGKINLFPVPDNSTKNLTLLYTREPVEITLVSETPELSIQFHPRIVEYCLAQAMELDDNGPGSMAKMAQFDSRVRETISNTNWPVRREYPMISVSPDDTFGEMGGF